MLRMMSEEETEIYRNSSSVTPEPTPELTVEPFAGESMSSYGYVESMTVNFRKEPSTGSERIRTLNQYAFCLILGTVSDGNQTWYKVWYNGETGYISGDYFKQMTIDEMYEFQRDGRYAQGLESNRTSGTTSLEQNTDGSPAIISAEDQQVHIWTNPDSGLNVSYEPFDPFATPEPLVTAEPEITGGVVAQTTEAYTGEWNPGTDTTNPDTTTEYKPLETTAPDDLNGGNESSGSSFGTFLLVAALLLVAGGGGYAAYMYSRNKKKAAQRAAERKAKAAQQKNTATGGQTTTTPRDNANGTVNARDAAKASRVRTGTYTSPKGSAFPDAVPSEKPAATERKFGQPIDNPFGRYSAPKNTGAETDDYAAPFRPAKTDDGLTEGTTNLNNQGKQRTKRTDKSTFGSEDDIL